jgi:hypothetical protein
MNIKFEPGIKFKLFAPVLLNGATGLGVLHMLNEGTSHALVRLSNGKLVRMNQNVIRGISKETRETLEALLVRHTTNPPKGRAHLRMVR